MILYEYFCDVCETARDIYHSMDEKPEVLCQSCGKPMYKKMGAAAVIFRGGCWAKDGYEPHTKIRRGREYDRYKAARNEYERKHGKLGGGNE